MMPPHRTVAVPTCAVLAFLGFAVLATVPALALEKVRAR